MSAKLKLAIYGEPGTGKSVFAASWPKPFFICADDNYEWLVDFGANPKHSAKVLNYYQFRQMSMQKFESFDTVVIDLLEDMYSLCEQDYCVKNSLSHVSDQQFGKGYHIVYNEFFNTILRFLSLDKHVILIMHSMHKYDKNQNVYTVPSHRLPLKLTSMIEGRLRAFLRVYINNGIRTLSLSPSEHEFGVLRGVHTNIKSIELDYTKFMEIITHVKN